jgi:hypothetical protein
MLNTRVLSIVAMSLIVVGCASNPPKTIRSEFEDIPVPRGLSYQQDKSTIIESPNVKAARLLYRGRIEPTSLGVAMRQTLEANGWRHVSTTSGSKSGMIQVYEKSGNSLQVQIYEGLWFTYVAMDASRATISTAKPSS